MSQRSRILASILLAGSMLVTAVTAWDQFPNRSIDDAILSGADVGFRVTGVDPRNGQPTGVWVVRMQGRWVEVTTSPGIRPAK